MSQLFANAARSPLMANILAGDTSLTVDAALADLYPVATTGTDPVPTAGKDFFKIVLENAAHEKEIVYVRTRALGSPIFSNVVRGQEGTTARAYTAGDIVGLRHTATDLAGAIDLAANATTAGKALLNAATAAAQRLLLGFSTFFSTLIGAADAPAFRALVGVLANSAQDFRLSLTSGMAVTTADVTGASTIYAVPNGGKYIDLYDGTAWNRRSSAQFSIALSGLTDGIPHDVFCYDNATVPTLEVLAWTSDSARATALVSQDGVLVKAGAPTRRYLGTFVTTSATTTEDSLLKRYLWNYYHRKTRIMQALEPVASWTYGSVTPFRQANANTANQVTFVVGVVESPVHATVMVNMSGNTAGTTSYLPGIGIDSTLVNSATLTQQAGDLQTTSHAAIAKYTGFPAVGRRSLVWLESCTGGTAFVYGSGAGNQSGLIATIKG